MEVGNIVEVIVDSPVWGDELKGKRGEVLEVSGDCIRIRPINEYSQWPNILNGIICEFEIKELEIIA